MKSAISVVVYMMAVLSIFIDEACRAVSFSDVELAVLDDISLSTSNRYQPSEPLLRVFGD